MITTQSIIILFGAFALMILASGTIDAQADTAVPGTLCSLAAQGKLTQWSSGDNRELCLQDCRDQYGTWVGPGWNNYSYASCVSSCENRFWRDFDRRTRELEREGREMG